MISNSGTTNSNTAPAATKTISETKALRHGKIKPDSSARWRMAIPWLLLLPSRTGIAASSSCSVRLCQHRPSELPIRGTADVALSSDLDLEARTVTIKQKITEVNGTLHVGRPKTHASARTVDLLAVVVNPLAEYLLRYPPSPAGLSSTARMGTPFAGRSSRAAWFKALEDAKINKHVRPERLRHSGASLA
jgi:hypothetical protein